MLATTTTSCEMCSLTCPSNYSASPELEKGSDIYHSHSHTCPADILISLWPMGKLAVCDIIVVHLLNSNWAWVLLQLTTWGRDKDAWQRMVQNVMNLSGSASPWLWRLTKQVRSGLSLQWRESEAGRLSLTRKCYSHPARSNWPCEWAILVCVFWSANRCWLNWNLVHCTWYQ